MSKKTIVLKQADDFSLKIYHYPTNEKHLGSILLMTGMCEHYERYEEFIYALNSNGYDVYTYDHRGQGKDYSLNELGFISDKNGHSLLISDALSAAEYIQKLHPSKSFFIIGHSMGSIIARILAAKVKNADGVIMISTAYDNSTLFYLGNIMVKLSLLFINHQAKANLFTKMLFRAPRYNNEHSKTKFDWITRDVAVIGKYLNDPYCGYVCTFSFFKDLTQLAYIAAKKSFLLNTPKALPILILGGTDDPIGSFSKAQNKLFNFYKQNHYLKVKKILYKDCRHELLNELNKEEITSDIITWIAQNTN
jgi:alpha-beta hydrolase superfamily lysophospholipase